MIKKVILYNFESHENTTINFAQNFNLIVGESNSGKSAIIRAMGVVVNNNWDKDMVRSGCDFCRVTIETNKGWVEAERGEKINRWRCQENGQEIQSFKNVGTNVPDLATKILGMGERDRGGDIKQLPNFQFQLEKHYMLAEIGQKKSTSNMIARMMDNAIGLGGMEDLIKDISTDLLKDKKWLTEKQNEISELKSSIIDEKIFESYQELVEKINLKFKKIENLNEDINIADAYLIKYNEILNNKNKHQRILNNLSNIEESNILKDKLNCLFKKIIIIDKINNLEKKKKSLLPFVQLNVESLNLLLEKCNKYKKIIKLCEHALNNDIKFQKTKKALEINFDLINKKREILSLSLKKIKEAQKRLETARKLWKDKSLIEKENKLMINELNDLNKEYETMKKELGFCPLCGEKFK